MRIRFAMAVSALAIAVFLPGLAGPYDGTSERPVRLPEVEYTERWASWYPNPWSVYFSANVMLNQNSYSDNWVGWGAGSIYWTFYLNSTAEKQLLSRLNNKHTLNIYFGQSYSQNKETKVWSEPMKSSDNLEYESLFRLRILRIPDIFVAGRVQTQFLDDRDKEKLVYLNPAILTESFGLAVSPVKSGYSDWTVRLGLGFRQYFNRGKPDSLVGKNGEHSSRDYGLEFVNYINLSLARNAVSIRSEFAVFQALSYSQSRTLAGTYRERYWRAPDFNWDNTLSSYTFRYIRVDLHLQVLYDKEIDPGARFMQALSLGLSYQFNR
jgi:hypothetical protein